MIIPALDGFLEIPTPLVVVGAVLAAPLAPILVPAAVTLATAAVTGVAIPVATGVASAAATTAVVGAAAGAVVAGGSKSAPQVPPTMAVAPMTSPGVDYAPIIRTSMLVLGGVVALSLIVRLMRER